MDSPGKIYFEISGSAFLPCIEIWGVGHVTGVRILSRHVLRLKMGYALME